ncbi:hypothetical protein [Pseudomonas phage PIP]|nr:hypothetical protein [Pseudomonas phage PIP]
MDSPLYLSSRDPVFQLAWVVRYYNSGMCRCLHGRAYIGTPQFHKASLKLVALCGGIITDSQWVGLPPEVRQLYYQLMKRGYQDTVRSYGNIVALVVDARSRRSYRTGSLSGLHARHSGRSTGQQ